jgi:hypothetical protein
MDHQSPGAWVGSGTDGDRKKDNGDAYESRGAACFLSIFILSKLLPYTCALAGKIFFFS